MYSLDFTSRNMWGWMKAVIPLCERRTFRFYRIQDSIETATSKIL